MTWVAWRVQRSQLVAAVAVVGAFAIWLVASGLFTGHSQTFKYWTDADIYVLYALPGVLGLAIGAPLIAAESHLHTNRLAWTQSVTRERWLARKLLVGGLVSVGLVVLLTLLLQWWTGAVSISALTQSGGFSGLRIWPDAFDVTGLVIVGYTMFAFFLGAALGTIIRRPGWAFAMGLPCFAAVRIVVQWLRPHLVAPAIYTSLIERASSAVNHSWLLNITLLPTNRTSPPPGKTWSWWDASERYEACQSKPNPTNASDAHCAVVAHVHFVFQYQPESHYWVLQGIETAIFVGLGLVLFGFTMTMVKRWRN
jgi:ABC-type transport system involved in multi-copper enzyme maturation permease subunit